MEESRKQDHQSQLQGAGSSKGNSNAYARRFTPEEKLALMKAYETAGMTMLDFCVQHGVTTKSLCDWRRNYAALGEAGLMDKPNPRNSKGCNTQRRFTPDQKREAVEAWQKSGMTKDRFSIVWGVTDSTLGKWVRLYEEGGPKSLESPSRTPGSKLPRPGVPIAVKKSIEEVKTTFPTFGLRKIRDFLLRFRAVKVSPGSIRKTLREANLEGSKPAKKYRKKTAQIRRFERSRPGELWQSDITSFVLTRHNQRVYLVAFLDDYSRYVVSWGLHLQQKQEMVIEALKEGIARFGKPVEVLTDQGRQYFSWRGKNDFQKLLRRDGIKHVVARTHHPQTVGKTERFWETVRNEFWERVQPQELSEARERLAHFIAHYNHFRPHQGIDGMVPADRFFGVESQVRQAMESALSQNELLLAIGEEPRRPVFLVGTIGDQQVSLHGERGKLVIQTPEGGRQEMSFNELGSASKTIPAAKGVDHGRTHGDAASGDNGGRAATGGPEAESPQSPDQITATPAGTGESAVGVGDRGGETEGAPSGSGVVGGVAGTNVEEGSGREAGDPAASDLATVAAGGVGDGSGAPETAQDSGEGETRDGGPEEHEGDGEANRGVGTADAGPTGTAGTHESDAALAVSPEGSGG